MNFPAFLAERRDGLVHSEADLRAFAVAAAKGHIPDYQLAAWLMAAYLNPLGPRETAWLTLGMAESGERIDLTGLPKPWVDKHSTGGVGDKTTLVLLPLLAACGLTMVKMSGRGLGITGGTVDKLASVPGFRLDLSPAEMKAQAQRIGLALTGQTPSLAPADKVLYALRDATGTVANVPLIVSSILSKKIAGGAEVVALDVKCGSGAFMRDLAHAQELSAWLEDVGTEAGLTVKTHITDMDQPLGSAVGNALEVAEALRVLQGATLEPTEARFRELCLVLAEATLEACGMEPGLASRVLESGAALEKARLWFQAQGAELDPGGDLSALPRAPFAAHVVHEGAAGWVARSDAATIGQAVLDLGGGRKQKEDLVDPAVGLRMHAMVGSRVEPGQRLATVYAAFADAADRACAEVRRALTVSEEPVAPRPLVMG